MSKYKKSEQHNWLNNKEIIKIGDIILFEGTIPPLTEVEKNIFIVSIRNLIIMMTDYIIKEKNIQDEYSIKREYIRCIQFIKDILKSKGICISRILEKYTNN